MHVFHDSLEINTLYWLYDSIRLNAHPDTATIYPGKNIKRENKSQKIKAIVSQDVLFKPSSKTVYCHCSLFWGVKKPPLPPAALWYDSFICDTYLLRVFCHVGRFFAPETLYYIPLDDCAIYWNYSMSSTIMRRKPKGGNKKVNLINSDLNVLILYSNKS